MRFLAVALAALLFGGFAYVDALFVHVSSTSALVFIFIPLYQLLAASIALVLALAVRGSVAKTT